MVSQELSEAYGRLSIKAKLHKDAIKLGSFITKLGNSIIILSFIFIFVPSTLIPLEPGSMLIGGFTLGILLLYIGQKVIDRKTHLAPLSLEEQEFLNFVDSLNYIETFKKDGIEFSRIEATKILSEFVKQLKEPNFEDKLWKNLTQEANENLRLLKKNIKEKLIPCIAQGKKGDTDKASLIIQGLAKYLLNPTVSEVKDLNKSMLELDSYPPEKSRLVPFFGHPYMYHVYFLIFFIACGIFAYYLSKHLGSSTDSAISNGLYATVALIAGYMICMVKKS